MGMAASQARYLALAARKSNCEYEGQQINQARTALANQTANLFNQMLGLNVPVPPSTRDFTTTQYSFKDGLNASTISSWKQLATPESDYNYVVTHYYYYDRYTGSQKMLTDPQVQVKGGNKATRAQIQEALKDIEDAEKAYESAKKAREEEEAKAKELSYFKDAAPLSLSTASLNDGNYTINLSDGDPVTYSPYASLSDDDKANVDKLIAQLQSTGALPKDFNNDNIYYDSSSKKVAFLDALKALNGISGTATSLNTYNVSDINSKFSGDGTDANPYKLKEVEDLRKAEIEALQQLNAAKAVYDNYEHPEYIGNCKLTPLSSLDSDQEAEIAQIVADMIEQGIDADIVHCYDPNGDPKYTGGIYSFKMNGITYYTTYNDLIYCNSNGEGINNIDGQPKLAYYNANYVKTKVEETEKALLETDGSGRFTSVRFENDTLTYPLEMEQVTDEVAYKDAMNQYYYENAVYDKTVQDINAKTSIIQHEDLQLELRLKQLDTEQNALSKEMEAVQKVVKDNVDKTFNTFGG